MVRHSDHTLLDASGQQKWLDWAKETDPMTDGDVIDFKAAPLEPVEPRVKPPERPVEPVELSELPRGR